MPASLKAAFAFTRLPKPISLEDAIEPQQRPPLRDTSAESSHLTHVTNSQRNDKAETTSVINGVGNSNVINVQDSVTTVSSPHVQSHDDFLIKVLRNFEVQREIVPSVETDKQYAEEVLNVAPINLADNKYNCTANEKCTFNSVAQTFATEHLHNEPEHNDRLTDSANLQKLPKEDNTRQQNVFNSLEPNTEALAMKHVQKNDEAFDGTVELTPGKVRRFDSREFQYY